jgi:hypothetical protein
VKPFEVSISGKLTNIREINLVVQDPELSNALIRWLIVEPAVGEVTCELSIPSDARLLEILDEFATDPPKLD